MAEQHEYRRTNAGCVVCMQLRNIEDTENRQLNEGDDNFFHVPQLIASNPDDGDTDTESVGGSRRRKKRRSKKGRSKKRRSKKRRSKKSRSKKRRSKKSRTKKRI
jgi:hypothetical protein